MSSSINRQRAQIQRRGREAVGLAGVAMLLAALFMFGSLIPELWSGGIASAARVRTLATLLLAVGLAGIGLWVVSKSPVSQRKRRKEQ